MMIDMCNFTTVSPVLNETFQLARGGGKLGLPPGVTFDPAAFRRMFQAQHQQSAPNLVPLNMDCVVVTDDTSGGFLHRKCTPADE